MNMQAGAQTDRFLDREVMERVLKISDVIFLFAASLFISLVSVIDLDSLTPQTIGFLALELTLICVFAIRALDLYTLSALTQPAWTALRTAAVCYFVIGLLFALTHIYLAAMDWNWLSLWMVALPGWFGATRGGVAIWARPRAAEGCFRQRIAIVGGGRMAEDSLALLETSRGLDIEIVGLFDDREDLRSPQSIRTYHKLGRIEELAHYARARRVDLIVVAIPLSAEKRLLTILKRLWELPVDIRISGHTSTLKLNARAYTYLGKLPLLPVFDRPLKGWTLFQKEALDRVLALTGLILLSPLMLAVAAAVRLESKGPVIFRQTRYGFNNEMIEVLKFRSMRTESCDPQGMQLVSRDDARVTRVGRFLRKTSLDELPQLINVLFGQLSLVGPRPHATQAKAADQLYESAVDGYFARHKVKPGLTGWAQVNGWRGETDTREKLEERVKHDLEYIDKWSLLFDFYIILKTPLVVLKGENAY